MGAKTTMLVATDGDAKASLATCKQLDRVVTVEKLAECFPGQRFKSIGDGSLDDTYISSEDEVYIGHFGSATVIASIEFAHDKPTDINPHFFQVAVNREVYSDTMHSVVDFF